MTKKGSRRYGAVVITDTSAHCRVRADLGARRVSHSEVAC